MVQMLEGTGADDTLVAPPLRHFLLGKQFDLCGFLGMLLCPPLPICLYPSKGLILGLFAVPGA